MPHFRRLLGLLIALFPLLTLAVVFTPPAAAAPAVVNYVVGNGHPGDCDMTALAYPFNHYTDASITFNCGGPATIPITQSGGLNVVSGQQFTIQGGDVITLTGLSAHRLFYVQTGSALTLTHLVLTHGFDNSSAGAIRKDSSTYLALDHVTLSYNQSLGSGGAINDAGGTLQVTNSLFDHNTGTFGGAIFSGGTLTTTNTTFSNNSASNTGGALELLGPTAISGGQVSANAAAQQGGALHINSAAVVTVDHVVFDGNYTLTPTVSLLYNGGAIHTSGPLTVTNSSFTRNSAVYGGALFNFNTRLYLSNDTLSNNAAVANGGALSSSDGGFTEVHGSTLSLNTAANGGALHNNDAPSNLSLYNTTVTQNTADVLGGGIYVENGIVSLHDQSSLSGNTAQAGGGLYSHTGGHPQIFDSTVADNHATNENGGGLYLEAGSVGGVINVVFSGNHAEGTGGAIDNEADGFSVFGSTLVDNRAVFGAAMYNAGANAIIGSSVIRGNTAGGDGGGIYNAGVNLNIGTTTLQGNLAVSGGGIDNEAGASIWMYQSTVAENVAEEAGGVLNVLSATLTLQESTLSGNTATINGGGLESGGAATLINATLANNGAPSGGALLTDPGATLVLTDTLLAYSSAGGNCTVALNTIKAVRFTVSSDNTCGLSQPVNGHSPNHLDPLLTGLGNYGGPTLVHMLKHNSPVLDGVIGNGLSTTDQRGKPRPNPGGSWDPGAVERQPTDSDLAPWVWVPLARR